MSVARSASPAFALVLALCLSFFAFGADAPWQPAREGLQPVPALTGRVNDSTGTLSAGERQALEAKLAQWEASTGNQLAVLIVPTTLPESIEEYSLRVAEAWKIGHKGSDNGALFLVAKNDKKMRIEVGYGLEGSLTDVTSRRIIGDVVAPLFSRGQFAAGIDAGVDQIMKVVGNGAGPSAAPRPAKRESSGGGGFDLGTLFVILLVVVPVVGSILRSILGTGLGSLAGAGIAGAAAWFVAGSLLIAGVAAVVAFVVILFSIFGGRGGGGFIPMGGGGGFSSRGGGGGGGFSGGGGSFGGGGASGGWN